MEKRVVVQAESKRKTNYMFKNNNEMIEEKRRKKHYDAEGISE